MDKSVFLTVYPHPTRGIVQLNSAAQIKGIRVVDLNGKLVQTQAAGATQLNLSDFPSGIYVLHV